MNTSLRKRSGKERITICTDSQSVVTALVVVSKAKILLVADYTENQAQLSEKKWVTIVWTPRHNGISKIKLQICWQGKMRKPDLLPLSFNSYKSKIKIGWTKRNKLNEESVISTGLANNV